MNDDDLIEKEQKWSWVKFFIGIAKMITSPEFIVFGIFTLMTYAFSFVLKVTGNILIFLIVTYGVVALSFMFHPAIKKLLSEKTNIDVKASVGANATFTGDLNKTATDVIDRVKR
jgi:hypothetical protein